MPEETIADSALLSRIQGCWLGQLTGDALGSMVEFQSAEEIRRHYPDGLRRIGPSPGWHTIAGQPTDDSEMALALAHTLLAEGGYDDDRVAEAYVQWLESHPFDVGTTTLQALTAMRDGMARGDSPAEAGRRGANRGSAANGALMRQSPLAIWGHALDPKSLDRIVRADASLTHPNHACLDASAAFIVALAATIRDDLDGEEAYQTAIEWDRSHGGSSSVTEALANARQAPPHFQPRQGYVLIALQNAFYRALHAPSFEEGVVQTVMSGGDTDTNAAIAGSLLGAIHGVSAIPEQWQEAVLSCRPQAGLPGVRHPRPTEYWPADALTLSEKLAESGAAAAS